MFYVAPLSSIQKSTSSRLWGLLLTVRVDRAPSLMNTPVMNCFAGTAYGSTALGVVASANANFSGYLNFGVVLQH